MPKSELSCPDQVISWLESWGAALPRECRMILIGSAGVLWHAARAGLNDPLPSNSMDVDPVTADEEVAKLCYEAMIGSEFEMEHGWHVNLMPSVVMDHLPADWESRSSTVSYGNLAVTVPSVPDLFVPKLKRGEPRDLEQYEYAKAIGLVVNDA